MVGTRNVTAYGKEATHRLATDLVRHNITIISGLARRVEFNGVARQVGGMHYVVGG